MNNNNEIDITELIQKYEQMRYSGTNVYFDSDEFALLADYYNEFGDTAEAEYILEIGLNIHPSSSQLMIIKAKVFLIEEKYQEAYNYLVAIADDDLNVDYLLAKLESLLYLNRFDEADNLLSTTLKSDMHNEDLYTFVTEAAYLFNDVDKHNIAIELLETALKVDSTNIDVLIDLSFAYEMISDFDKAIEINNSVLDQDPFSFDAWVNIGKLYSIQQQYDKAIEAFDFALTLNESEVGVLKMKALSLYLNDNTAEAVCIFKECLENYPDDETLYDSLLEGYEVMEQYDEMLEVIDKKEKRFGSEGILLLKAHVYLNQEKYDKAQEIFEQISDKDKNSFDYFVLEGELAIHNKDLSTAETAYMLAMLDSPEDEIVIDKLSNISLEQGKNEKAAEYLEQLLVLNPDFPTAKARLAFVRFEIGAKEPFDEILSQFSDDELRALLNLVTNNESADYSSLNRDDIIRRLNEARENRVLFRNSKY